MRRSRRDPAGRGGQAPDPARRAAPRLLDLDRRRMLLMALSGLLLLGGLVGAGVATVAFLATPPDPQLVPSGQPFTVRAGAFLGGEPALFANVRDQRTPPSATDYGCSQGTAPLTSAPSRTEYGERVLDGTSVIPVVQLPGGDGAEVVCTGAAARDTAPLWVVFPERTSKQNGLTVAVLAALLAAAGVVVSPLAHQGTYRRMRRGRRRRR